jgi:tetratricopeptide (TPR) repeat protein
LASGPERNYPTAIEHLTKAIKQATPLSQEGDDRLRKHALHTLIDANLAIGRCIAAGNYNRKAEVVPKWLNKAISLAKLTKEESPDNTLGLRVAARMLAAYAAMEEPLDPTSAVEQALATGQTLIASSNDQLFKQHVEWQLGCALLDAVQIEHARGEFSVAMQYANNALVLMSDNASHREATAQRDYALGRMFFAVGALYAIGNEDHAEGVHYYLKALPLLSRPLPPEFKSEAGQHGERFISMGVSFWQNGNQQQAIDLTLTGVEHVRDAIQSRAADEQSLAVPYGNLAAMYRQLGNTTEAHKFTELAKKLESSPATKRR